MRGKAPVEGGAALGENLEEHTEGAPRPVDLALDHGHRKELVFRLRVSRVAKLGETPLDRPGDRMQPLVRGGEVLGPRSVGHVFRPEPHGFRRQGHELASTARQSAGLDPQEAHQRVARDWIWSSHCHDAPVALRRDCSLQPTLMVIVAGPGTLKVRLPPWLPPPLARCARLCARWEGALRRRSKPGFWATLAAVRAITFG